ncbi:MAG: alpha/beta hydrolase [Clostridia bacterium]|nr:alpha/beta hydrolase [Clostridia bacterium]
MKLISDIEYGSLPEQKLDLYIPDCESYPTFLYFHGGGIENGSKENSKFYSALCKMGVAVATANYRMYPDAKFPEFIEDCALCTKWVLENIKDYGGDIKKVFVGGSSAGGYLSMMLCFDKHYLKDLGVKVSDIAGFVFDAGQPTTHFNVLAERGFNKWQVHIDNAAPLYFIDGTEKYPPFLVIVSDNDMTNRLEQTNLLMSTLKHLKCDENASFMLMENSTHCSYVNKQDENGRYIFADIVYNYIKENI